MSQQSSAAYGGPALQVLPVAFEEAILWLETQNLYIHNFWRWNPDLEPSSETKFYCALSTPRAHASNKVYAAGRGPTPMAALTAAWENYLSPPKAPITKIAKAEIAISLDDLGL